MLYVLEIPSSIMSSGYQLVVSGPSPKEQPDTQIISIQVIFLNKLIFLKLIFRKIYK